MTAEEIETLARDSKPMPNCTTLPDACLYEAMAALWWNYRSNRIGREEAHERKMRLLRRYAEYSAAYDNSCKVYREQQDAIRTAGTLLSDIEKAGNVQEVAELSVRLIGTLTGDGSFAERQMKKWREKECEADT